MDNLKFNCDEDSLKVCKVEREISEFLFGKFNEESIDQILSTVIKKWEIDKNKIIECLEHSIKPAFLEVKGRKHGIKKVRPELFFELYDLVNHHLVMKQKYFKSSEFAYQMGAVIELYNWMNTYALDDVFDNSEYRQNMKTVWFKYSRRDAIFTGIIGHLLTLKYILLITKDNLKIGLELSDRANHYNYMMYQGQVLDLKMTFDDDEKKKLLLIKNFDQLYNLYIQRIYGICGGFFEMIGDLASQAGNKKEQIYNSQEIDKISPIIGMHYGIIQMIRNDLGDYIMPDEHAHMSKGMKDISHSDIVEGKVDIAYLIALKSEFLSSSEKKYLYDILYTKLTREDKLKINQLLWKSSAIEATVELIIKLIEYVKEKYLSCYHETPTRMKWMFNLVDITRAVLIPFKNQAIRYGWTRYDIDQKFIYKMYKQIIEFDNKSNKERLSIFYNENNIGK